MQIILYDDSCASDTFHNNGSLCGIHYITTLVMYSMNENGTFTGASGYLSIRSRYLYL